jgi:multiple sugar transport system permease protein
MATTLNQTRLATPTRYTTRKKFSWTPYLFILPHLVFFLAFLAWPFFYGIYISLFNFDFLRPDFRPFVGLDNYANLFDPTSIQYDDFWRAMFNTVIFILYSVPLLVIVALGLAVLLNAKAPGQNFFRLIYFAPYALSPVVAAMIWRWMFEQGGLFNSYQARLGLPETAWLGSMPWAWIAITVCTVWWTVGFNTIIFVAALQEIPPALYEAAQLDGANRFRQFWSITVPMLRSVLVFVVTTSLLASANLFAQPLIMTGGGPVRQTEPIMLRIYTEGILQNRMGSAAAMSIFVAALLLVVTITNFRIFGRTEDA